MSRGSNLAKNTAILTFGQMCTQGISFLLLPLYTGILDTAEYGTFDLMVTYGAFLFPIVGMQYDQGIFRFMLDARENKEKQSELFSTVLAADLLHIVVYNLILVLISIIIDVPHTTFLMAYVTLHVLSALLMQFVRGLGKSKVYAMSSFLSAAVTIGLNVICLVVLKLGVEGLFISTLLATAIAIGYMSAVIKPWQYFSVAKIQKPVLRAVRNYSLPLVPNNLVWWVVDVSDRTIVSYILGVAVNGIYTVANKFSTVFITFYNVFNLSWTETVSLHYQDEDRDVFLSETITTIYKLFSSACFGIVACMPFVFPILIHSKYSEAYNQIIILMYAMLFRVVVGLYSCIYVAMKDSKKIVYTSAASAIINLAVNILMISKIGLYAASISTLAAFAIMSVIRYIDINRTIHMKIDKWVLAASALLAMVLCVTYYMNITWLNLIMLGIVIVYALFMNKDILKAAVRIIKGAKK